MDEQNPDRILGSLGRWKQLSTESPPLDRQNRCDDLWLYDAEGTDVVVRGSYVDFGEDEAGPDVGEFTDLKGQPLNPTHWALPELGEESPPPPPRL